ncbi:hypothetical protein DFS33DRAFT_1380987 [Desarmillaria ectypa]|nr:hypothetical protein DFS33DRAFT_1380987 [Desarmillaria ectypa]
MDSHSITSEASNNYNDSTEYSQDSNSEYTPDDPYLAADLDGRIFIPPDAFLSTLLRLPEDWRTNTTVRGQIDSIRRDIAFQVLANEYAKVSSGTNEGQPGHLYDGMLVRVLELIYGADKRGISVRPHFLEFATRDQWLDNARGARYRLLPKAAPAEEDVQDRKDGSVDAEHDATKEDIENEEGMDEDEEPDDVAKRWKMSMRLGLLLAPKKAQPLYYDRSAIIICEALDVVDKHDEVTDIFIAMLIGFSAVPPNSGLPSFLE